MSTFRTLTTQSSMLTGFCFGGMHAAQGSEAWRLNLVFLAVTASSMGFGLLCITTATFVSVSILLLTPSCFQSLIFGTQRALMGDHALASMDTAII